MRLRHLLRLTAAIASLAGAVQAQTGAAPMTVKDGTGAAQPLCEYKVDGTNLAGCTTQYAWNGAWSLAPGPCAKIQPINAAESGASSVTVDSGISPANKIHVCAILLQTAGAQAISVVEGSGAGCSNPVALIGSTTAGASAGLQLFAGQAINQAAATAFLQTQTALDHLCFVLGVGAGGTQLANIAGYISYGDY